MTVPHDDAHPGDQPEDDHEVPVPAAADRVEALAAAVAAAVPRSGVADDELDRLLARQVLRAVDDWAAARLDAAVDGRDPETVTEVPPVEAERTTAGADPRTAARTALLPRPWLAVLGAVAGLATVLAAVAGEALVATVLGLVAVVVLVQALERRRGGGAGGGRDRLGPELTKRQDSLSGEHAERVDALEVELRAGLTPHQRELARQVHVRAAELVASRLEPSRWSAPVDHASVAEQVWGRRP